MDWAPAQKDSRDCAAALGVSLGTVVAVSPAAGQGASNQETARAAETTPTLPAKLSCAMLVQDGATRNTSIPDFQEIPGAPTRITSARVVAATDTQPENCERSTDTCKPGSSFN